MNTFDKLSPQLKRAINRLNITTPTKIQDQTIPAILEGKDVIGESATGSGKTLAFGCGIIEHAKPKSGLQALVLTPTRELAEQVKKELEKLSHEKPLRIITVYGGVAIGPQINGLKFADVVVATPGRLLDHLERRTIDLSKVKLLVLDEADRMFEMGFIDDVVKIIKCTPENRQSLFFSATISKEIDRLSQKHMRDPISVSATKMVDPAKLKQVYYPIRKHQKLSLLTHLLQKESSDLVMVFCNSRKNTDFVTKNLKANKISTIALHGGYSQNKRTKTMENFNDAKARVLVCTDVAARGLHIDNVTHIYNYDIPNDSTDYVHRIGRTARAGEEGKVINILCEHGHGNFQRVLDEHRNLKIEKLGLPTFKSVKAVGLDQERRRPFQHGGRTSSHRTSRGRGRRTGWNN
jgi:ATP-dependent RNA helicase DeaD